MLLIKLFFAIAIGGALWNRKAYRVMKTLNWALVMVVFNAMIITYSL